MPRANDAVEALLQEYADLLSISGGDAFRVRTYEKAARSIGGYHADLSTLDEKGILGISNVGKSIVGKVRQALETGTFEQLEELRERVPAGVREMISIPTLGPKKALMLYRDLRIASVQELADAIDEGRLAGIKGFGPKTEENILRGISVMQQSGQR
ncbi:MAG TPA: helix-hairpin-helix domain-containing protein, partial [Actinomycetota bacterium]|nr:helix-hairpin-helix domain-containing protein [Actinomycetota bacterium]